MSAPWLRRAALLIGAFGALIFGAALAASLLEPMLVEKIGREVIRIEIEKKVGEKIEALDQATMGKLANRVLAAQVAELKQQLRERTPARIAAMLARMQQADCECRRKIERRVQGLMEVAVTSLENQLRHLDEIVRERYQLSAERITLEFRIFSGANALVFLALFAAGMARPRAGVHLLPVTLVLLLANLVTGYFYLFRQDWLATVIFGHYVGWYYLAYLACVFLLLADIALNRARVTGRVLQACSPVGGGSVVILPC